MFEQYALYVIIALGALAAIVVLTFAFRTVAGTVKGRRGSRLGISEYYEIDKQRRLVLVRRDDVEHLVLIGGNQELVIETAIPAEGLQPQEVPAAARLRSVEHLDVDEQEAQGPELLRREPELARQEPELPRQEPAVVRPMPLRAAPRPAVFGSRENEEERPARTEPRLQAVPPQQSQNEA